MTQILSRNATGAFPPIDSSGGLVRDADRQWVSHQAMDLGRARHGWQDWDPTYSNLTVGNGTVIARYAQIGGLVICRYHITFGSTTSIDSSNPGWLAPVTPADYTDPRNNIGTMYILDSGSTTYQGFARMESNNYITVGVFSTSLSHNYITSTSISGTGTPITWATGDILSWQAMYEAEPADPA